MNQGLLQLLPDEVAHGLNGYVCGRRVDLRGYRIVQHSIDGWQISPPFPLAADSELRIYCNGAQLATLVGSQQHEAWDFEAYLRRVDALPPERFFQPLARSDSGSDLVVYDPARAMKRLGISATEARQRQLEFFQAARREFVRLPRAPITAITGLSA